MPELFDQEKEDTYEAPIDELVAAEILSENPHLNSWFADVFERHPDPIDRINAMDLILEYAEENFKISDYIQPSPVSEWKRAPRHKDVSQSYTTHGSDEALKIRHYIGIAMIGTLILVATGNAVVRVQELDLQRILNAR